jgi:hypothetical protein
MISTLLTLFLTAPPNLPSLPDVASVKTVIQCDNPKLTLIHVRDWHFVDRERFAIDVRDESDTELTDADVAELFEGHRVAVEVIQKQQKRVLRKLVKKLKIKQVYHEGFTAEQLPAYQKRIKTLKEFKPYLPDGDSGLDQLTRYEYQTDMLQIGAPGQLLIDGHIAAVIPAEDAEAYDAANPVKPDGLIVFDAKANEAREEAIVKNLMKASGTAVIVLGGAHDLSDNVPPGVRLLEVTVRGDGELAKAAE